MRSEMNGRHNQYETLSDYVEGNLSAAQQHEFDRARQDDPNLEREAQELRTLLQVLHQLPPREPVIDVWPELEPKLALIQAEERLSFFARWRCRIERFLSNFASGAILFTHAVALNTEMKMRKYVLSEEV